jgi:hypothetical protein
MQLTVANMGEVSSGVEEQLATKSAECKRLVEENRKLKAMVKKEEQDRNKEQAKLYKCSTDSEEECPLLVKPAKIADGYKRKKSKRNGNINQPNHSEQSTQTEYVKDNNNICRDVHRLSSQDQRARNNRSLGGNTRDMTSILNGVVKPTYAHIVQRNQYKNRTDRRMQYVTKNYSNHEDYSRDQWQSDHDIYYPPHQDTDGRHDDVPSQNLLRVCCYCGEENHRADRCRFGQQVRCFGCSRLRHKKRLCPWI